VARAAWVGLGGLDVPGARGETGALAGWGFCVLRDYQALLVSSQLCERIVALPLPIEGSL
jgi:hypothetical protein